MVYVRREVYRRCNDSSSPKLQRFLNPAIDYCPSQLYIITKSDYWCASYSIIFYQNVCFIAGITIISIVAVVYTAMIRVRKKYGRAAECG